MASKMDIMTGRAYCPGHVTGFFEICDADEPTAKKGSRGAGFCTEMGAETALTAAPLDAEKNCFEVRINGAPADAPVTRRTLELLLAGCEEKYYITVDTVLQLPVSQGMGMSAAGALSVALAAAEALRLERSYWDIARCAHAAEVELKTGLGDVVACATGGFDVRKAPGMPPHGFVDRIFAKPVPVVCCTVGPPLETRAVLTDAKRREAFVTAGRKCVDEFLQRPTLQRFLELSKEFAYATGLTEGRLRDAIEAVEDRGGLASVAMLGNAVFAFGDTAELVSLLAELGDVYMTEVTDERAHVIR